MSRHKIRSENAQEIISRKPSFSEKWAIVIFFGLIVLLIGLSWFVRYPEIVTANSVLASSNMPKEIVIPDGGRVARIFHGNNDVVKSGDMLVWLKCNGSHEQVLKLQSELDSAETFLSKNDGEKTLAVFKTHYSNLGELQVYYEQLVSSLNIFRDHLESGSIARKYKMLQSDIHNLKRILSKEKEQITIAIEEEKLKLLAYNRMEELYHKKIVSKLDLEQQRSIYLSAKQAREKAEVAVFQNQSEQINKVTVVDGLKNDLDKRNQNVIENLNNLRSQIQEWRQKYIIYAESSGQLALIIPVQQNQYLEPKTMIGFVNPSFKELFFYANVSQNNFGRVKIGQKVQLRLDAYPYSEFGLIYGKIDYISPVATEKGFMVTIKLANDLRTSSQKNIPYKGGLSAVALIITKESRLLQKLYQGVVK